MLHSFKRRRLMQAGMGAAVLLLATAFVGLGAIFPVRVVGALSILFGLWVGWLALSLIADIFAPDPILVIGPEGIRFLSFSPDTVPWRDITGVTITQGYYTNGSGVTGPDGRFAVSYTIGDPSAYAKRGGISRVERALMRNNTVSLRTATLIDATFDALIAAIREHYRGPIVERPIPGSTPAA